MQTKNKKFVYHYPSVNQPKQGITTVDVPPPVHYLKHTPVTRYPGDRMDNIAATMKEYFRGTILPRQTKPKVGFRVGHCHACGQPLPEKT